MNASGKSVRPRAHCTAARNAMYRCSGTALAKGMYWSFFETFPFSTDLVDRRFIACASSPDLIQWREVTTCVYPSIPQDRDGAREGSVNIRDDGSVTLYYVGLRFERASEEDLNRLAPDSGMETSIMSVDGHISGRGMHFSLTSKKVIFADERAEKYGLVPGTLRSPGIYHIRGKEVLTFLADSPDGGSVICFMESDEEGDFRLYGKSYLPDIGRVRSLSIFRCENKIAVVLEIHTGSDSTHETLLGLCSLDVEGGRLDIDRDSLVPLDWGRASFSPKVGYDSEGKPYVVSGLRTEKPIKGTIGMLSLPRTVDILNGRIETSIHPSILSGIPFSETEMKLRETHFPQLLKAAMSEGSYIDIGGAGIYFHSGSLHIDTRMRGEGKSSSGSVVEIQVSGDVAPLVCVVDQDILEIDCQGRGAVCIALNLQNRINIGEGVSDVSLQTMGHVKI